MDSSPAPSPEVDVSKKDRNEKKAEAAPAAPAPQQPPAPESAAAPAPEAPAPAPSDVPAEPPAAPAGATDAPAPAAESAEPPAPPVAEKPAPVVVQPAPNPPPGYAADPLGHVEELEEQGRFDEAAKLREAEGLPALSAEDRKELEAHHFRRQVDELAEKDPEFREKLRALSSKYEQAFYAELRGVVASMGSKQTIVKPSARYKVLEPVRVALGGGIRDLKAGDVLDESVIGPGAIKALLTEPRVKLEKLPD